ncbi:peptide-methionine (S)-S-oxide reductase [Colwellia sp. 4_MG-2023]|jgi:peptide-methionine (S)-S-oxide reductase|uniref:peptide-methionine (S)-S-oxide reductase n=1 Tax=unclassified Colwellia TaxID=196834 RepID=UPI001C092766|nr:MULTISPECIES: peptide-methionine (S)-S-oxide reductase [unclassified Colwellia]MBU2924493.1 peptide-methionine (S)-S-oxide reductase [Colwellia sp. C2M11]MDO6507367.1 peptide-methionine (S)-S-oxide reductase [Colwellia sp. 5_MG-2023]MDO6556100.1 peptide-methionine (S)-S-oxide reductase [Colwellia sp. 4_MG-2023]MDO6652904.1 peptide-methionine (S)-S-oxide reductase [Colwellia sp. 3_MG-2023]MDO6665386.1 peptide-methionine (S)-S-oxide reductase [Colwellia sp. 2_MG-2023]
MKIEEYNHDNNEVEVIYFAGGCLWGVQEFLKYLPGVSKTEAGRANGLTDSTKSSYDGYAECVKVIFSPNVVNVNELIGYFFEIIDPYSIDKQGEDVGKKYRTGIYSKQSSHLKSATRFINCRDDADKIVVEILPLLNYVKSDEEHQERLSRFPNDYCHIPKKILHKYK